MSAMAIHEPIMPSKPPPPVETETVRAPSPTHYSGAESDGEKSVNESESSQPSPVPTPLGSSLAGKRARQADVGTPSRNVAPKTEAAALAGDGNPERKIWMRPCNECGFDLHVRRTKCTECGAVQMSKRAAEHAKVTAERAVIEALDEEQMFARYPSADGRYIACLTDDLYIDGVDPELSNVARWMNHASPERANVMWRKQRLGPRKAMRFYTLRDVAAGDELCFDYGSEYWDALGETPL